MAKGSKMGFKEVTSLDADVTVRLGGTDKKTGKRNPQQQEGYYLGAKEINSPKSKSGKANLHIFSTAKGNVGVWGKTNMDQKLKSVTPGTMTRVTFKNMQATPNGEMYVYTVETDDTNTIEVGSVNTKVESEELSSAFNEDGSSDDYSDVDVDAELAAAAARKAAVLAKLQNKR
jgi:hypothetical protein